MNFLELDLDQILTLEEVKHFFSKTSEYTVKQCNTETVEIFFQESQNGKVVSLKEYQPTVQTLIRAVQQLNYNALIEEHQF